MLFDWEQGTKSFKDAYSIIKKVIEEYVPYNKKMIEKLSKIDFKQRKYKEKQSISLDEFLNWFNNILHEVNTIKEKRCKESRQNWLWVCAMCITYGLRPTEVAAAKNLFEPVIIDGYTFPAICDPSNKELLLVLGDFTYFEVSIKTGNRVCTPMIKSKEMIEKLQIRNVSLPKYQPKKESKNKTICEGFSKQYRQRLQKWECPVSQMYAFRHLANQLGEREGIPQEIRARSLGHSVAVNDSTYKKRSNIRTTVDLLLNHKKQPLPLDLAIEALKAAGFDVEEEADNSVKAILRIIYQIEL
ncbi:MAG: hypothetical protein J7647_22205 [Cyanobacteria bacterium SBLK]|nr:hypothetical protein [Cyanobacteria bacterium SBLK]